MNRNVVIILIGGFLIAVLVAIMVQAMLGGGKKQEVSQERMQILVAAKDLEVGKTAAPGDFKWQAWPEDAMFMGAIIRDGQQTAGEAVRGKLLRSISEGEPVHMTLVVEDDKGEFLAANVGKGMRAVSVPLSKSALADRLMRPGDFVDVLVTYRVRLNSRSNPEAQSLVNRYATETVIENVRILAIDTNDTKAVDEIETDGKKKRKTSSKQATLTLEVNPEQAEGLLLAKKWAR
jgi:pilus assembly protein CpaB